MRQLLARIDPTRLVARPAALVPAAVALAGCSGLDALDALVPESGYHRPVETVAYGDHPRMRFDLYLPADGVSPEVPPVLFFYGGSWREGARGGYRFIGQALASRGVPVAVADYRLFPEVRFPAFAQDAAKAAARLVALAPDYGMPARFVAMGHSAGAHTAATLALDPRYLDGVGVPRHARAGLVALSGPVFIDPMKYDSTWPVFAPVAETPDIGRPVAQVSADDPPAFLVHGGADDTVHPINSEKLAEALEAAGVPVRLAIRKAEGHIAPLVALSHPFAERDDPLAARIAWWIETLDAAPGA